MNFPGAGEMLMDESGPGAADGTLSAGETPALRLGSITTLPQF
ncbi:MAG: hypothetical protein P8X65_00675 [Syntrophobacterales bacterium]|jgi:hypothetical protein